MAAGAARAPSALAQTNASARATEQDSRARDLFEKGRVAYQEARYEVALDLFTQAHALSKRPQLLNNIGQAADRLRMDADALDAYQRYLAEVPDAENRAAVENRIAALKEVIEAKRQAPVPTPEETARAAEPAPRGTQAPSAATSSRDDDGSVLSAWWLWAGIGAAAVAGVIIGVAASGGTETVDGPTPRVDSATRVIEL
jgi:tetratricopeptide (TPR) repeat protein